MHITYAFPQFMLSKAVHRTAFFSFSSSDSSSYSFAGGLCAHSLDYSLPRSFSLSCLSLHCKSVHTPADYFGTFNMLTTPPRSCVSHARVFFLCFVQKGRRGICTLLLYPLYLAIYSPSGRNISKKLVSLYFYLLYFFYFVSVLY
jgi:hypothetical protein